MQSTTVRSSETTGVMPFGWYAAYTRPRHEKSAHGLLQRKGIETFLPLHTSARRWTDRTKLVELPLFPCYLFVRISQDSRLSVLTTAGVQELVSFATGPALIPECEIATINRIVKSGVTFGPHPFLQCGDSVMVKRGPLSGMEGILFRVKNECRVIVSVRLLQRSVAVEVDRADLEQVGPSRSRRVLQLLSGGHTELNGEFELLEPCEG